MSRQTTDIDSNGCYLYAIEPRALTIFPVPQIQVYSRVQFRANGLDQLGKWIIAQHFGVFHNWTYDSFKEDTHEEFVNNWKGCITLKSPKGNTYRFYVTVRYVNPPVPKTFGEMSDAEKMEAMAKALAKSGINI